MYICNTCAKHFGNISNCLVTKKVFQKWKTLDQSEKFVHSKLCPPPPHGHATCSESSLNCFRTWRYMKIMQDMRSQLKKIALL